MQKRGIVISTIYFINFIYFDILILVGRSTCYHDIEMWKTFWNMENDILYMLGRSRLILYLTIPLKTTRVYYTTTRHLSIDSSWEELQFQLYIIYAAILVHFCHIIVIMTVLHNNKPNDFWRKKTLQYLQNLRGQKAKKRMIF